MTEKFPIAADQLRAMASCAATEIDGLRAQLDATEEAVSEKRAEIASLRAQLAEEKAKHALTIQHFQAHPAERYWEGRWRDADAQLASARNALDFIRDSYDRNDISHVDFRIGAYKAALSALSDEKGNS